MCVCAHVFLSTPAQNNSMSVALFIAFHIKPDMCVSHINDKIGTCTAYPASTGLKTGKTQQNESTQYTSIDFEINLVPNKHCNDLSSPCRLNQFDNV